MYSVPLVTGIIQNYFTFAPQEKTFIGKYEDDMQHEPKALHIYHPYKSDFGHHTTKPKLSCKLAPVTNI